MKNLNENESRTFETSRQIIVIYVLFPIGNIFEALNLNFAISRTELDSFNTQLQWQNREDLNGSHQIPKKCNFLTFFWN